MSRRQTANGNNGGKWIRPDKRLAIYLRDGFACAYCGRDLHRADPFDVTLDHLNAQHRAGHHHEGNLVTCCRACNSARQDRSWTSYATGGAKARIRRNVRRKLTAYRRLAKAIMNGTAGDPRLEKK